MNVMTIGGIFGGMVGNSGISGIDGGSFAEELKKAESVKASVTSDGEMTMEEYKQYIYNRISMLPMHPSHSQDCVTIKISEKGFEAMKADPEYEEWVIGWLKEDFNTCNPWASICGGNYVVHYIGATKEQYHAESWNMNAQDGSDRYDKKSKDSFWERRTEQDKKRLEEQRKYREAVEAQEKRGIELMLYERSVIQNGALAASGKEIMPADGTTLPIGNIMAIEGAPVLSAAEILLGAGKSF